MDQPLREVTLNGIESRLLYELLLLTISEQTQQQLRALRASQHSNVEREAQAIAAAAKLLGVVGTPSTYQLTPKEISVLRDVAATGAAPILLTLSRNAPEKVLAKYGDPQNVAQVAHEGVEMLVGLLDRLHSKSLPTRSPDAR
ncbi:hypothetical protein [Azohydromonas lata]|uniref:Uncharacterized protein n=1 Tax=Azohydromonas lata TaxID=45677 RepID=A0ABU5IA56_9BURK|nr:hypothetical protein [Azohydromonas lata]MDZ5455797.1 hypothetical protein [Azohydromonas lata]